MYNKTIMAPWSSLIIRRHLLALAIISAVFLTPTLSSESVSLPPTVKITLDREARLAKLLNSACYGNPEAPRSEEAPSTEVASTRTTAAANGNVCSGRASAAPPPSEPVPHLSFLVPTANSSSIHEEPFPSFVPTGNSSSTALLSVSSSLEPDHADEEPVSRSDHADEGSVSGSDHANEEPNSGSASDHAEDQEPVSGSDHANEEPVPSSLEPDHPDGDVSEAPALDPRPPRDPSSLRCLAHDDKPLDIICGFLGSKDVGRLEVVYLSHEDVVRLDQVAADQSAKQVSLLRRFHFQNGCRKSALFAHWPPRRHLETLMEMRLLSVEVENVFGLVAILPMMKALTELTLRNTWKDDLPSLLGAGRRTTLEPAANALAAALLHTKETLTKLDLGETGGFSCPSHLAKTLPQLERLTHLNIEGFRLSPEYDLAGYRPRLEHLALAFENTSEIFTPRPITPTFGWVCKRKFTSHNVGSWLHDVRRDVSWWCVLCRGDVSWEGGSGRPYYSSVASVRGGLVWPDSR